ncbi:Metalloprotease TIKI2, partial [Lamprotornis superbus]
MTAFLTLELDFREEDSVGSLMVSSFSQLGQVQHGALVPEKSRIRPGFPLPTDRDTMKETCLFLSLLRVLTGCTMARRTIITPSATPEAFPLGESQVDWRHLELGGVAAIRKESPFSLKSDNITSPTDGKPSVLVTVYQKCTLPGLRSDHVTLCDGVDGLGLMGLRSQASVIKKEGEAVEMNEEISLHSLHPDLQHLHCVAAFKILALSAKLSSAIDQVLLLAQVSACVDVLLCCGPQKSGERQDWKAEKEGKGLTCDPAATTEFSWVRISHVNLSFSIGNPPKRIHVHFNMRSDNLDPPGMTNSHLQEHYQIHQIRSVRESGRAWCVGLAGAALPVLHNELRALGQLDEVWLDEVEEKWCLERAGGLLWNPDPEEVTVNSQEERGAVLLTRHWGQLVRSTQGMFPHSFCYSADKKRKIETPEGPGKTTTKLGTFLPQPRLYNVLFALNQTLLQHESLRAGSLQAPYTTEDLIKHYNCGDLNAVIFNHDTSQVPNFINTTLPPHEQVTAQEIDSYFRQELIYKRNERMGRRVMSLLRENRDKSFFFAFGADLDTKVPWAASGEVSDDRLGSATLKLGVVMEETWFQFPS